jgi:hypothetical protein
MIFITDHLLTCPDAEPGTSKLLPCAPPAPAPGECLFEYCLAFFITRKL